MEVSNSPELIQVYRSRFHHPESHRLDSGGERTERSRRFRFPRSAWSKDHRWQRIGKPRVLTLFLKFVNMLPLRKRRSCQQPGGFLI
jgi:hypothetical protein